VCCIAKRYAIAETGKIVAVPHAVYKAKREVDGGGAKEPMAPKEWKAENPGKPGPRTYESSVACPKIDMNGQICVDTCSMLSLDYLMAQITTKIRASPTGCEDYVRSSDMREAFLIDV